MDQLVPQPSLKLVKSSPSQAFSFRQYALILLVVVVAFFYALPNFFGESPSIQVSPRNNVQFSAPDIEKLRSLLEAHQIKPSSILNQEGALEFHFSDTTTQMRAEDLLQQTLAEQATVAMSLTPNTPKWLSFMGAKPMKLGLDLRGGMYFLLDIDMQTVIENTLQNDASSLRRQLREQNIRYEAVTVLPGHGLHVRFPSLDAAHAAMAWLTENSLGLVAEPLTTAEFPELMLNLSATQRQSLQSYVVEQTIQVMRNRVNELGVAEASVMKQGQDRVVIELPGVQDAARAKAIIGGTATLKVMMVDETADPKAALEGSVPMGSSLFLDGDGRPVVLKNQIILTGNSIVGADLAYDGQTGFPVVGVHLNGPEVSQFSRVTAEHVGHLMAFVLVEQNFSPSEQGVLGNLHTKQTAISVAKIHSQLGNSFEISGVGDVKNAQNLALLIRAGALPAPVQIVQEKQIGPSLGEKNIRMGAISVCVAMAVVMLFMLIYYHLFGLFADIALLINLVLIVAVMSLLKGATLTLPGIAGIVLNVGMAIDGNVLIFERIREELRRGSSVVNAIEEGFSRAFSTIIDANVTTLIVALILFAIGTGPIKGFSVTLIVGIATSMFTVVTITRALIRLCYCKRSVDKISIGI